MKKTDGHKKAAIEEIVRLLLKEQNPTKQKLHAIKIALSKKYGIAPLKNTEILPALPPNSKKLRALLKLRPMRTISGVTPVAVMSPPASCPHGVCLYCTRGENAAQSYTGFEPASLRAKQNSFDPYSQVEARLRQYHEMGHVTDKCELILMGGTFIAQKPETVKKFVKRCYDAFNGKLSQTLEASKKLNELSKNRVIGMTFETRPDYARQKHIDLMHTCGATRVELGVQALSDRVYGIVNRGHTIDDVVEATRICKDNALKVCYHIMPGLFSTPKEDIGYFKTIFTDSRFQPDMLKIYPTLVLKGTGLYELWKKGKYIPYDTETAAEVLAEATKYIPEYVRVMRIQRDIPANLIEAGVKKGNLREIVDAKLKTKGLRCRCIRCREIGLKGKKINFKNVILKKIEYNASEGKEIFLQFIEPKEDILIGFARLRFPGNGKNCRKEITPKTALIRELHVYGSEMGITENWKLISGSSPIDFETRGSKLKTGNRVTAQHKGFGKRLLEAAERIAGKAGMKKLTVISGVGAREYYRKLGYADDGVYVSKKIGFF